MNFENKIKEILKDPEIRFCALLDSEGNQIAGGFRKGVEPLESDEERKKIFQDLVARVAKRKMFDYNMGRVKYSASRREKLVIMSFPLNDNILMITAEPHVNIDRLAFKIIEKIGSQWAQFFGK